MSDTKLAVKHEEIEGAIQELKGLAEQVRDFKRMFNVAIIPLKTGGWKGLGADVFYQVADQELFKRADEVGTSIDTFGDMLRMALEIVNTADALTKSQPLTEMERAIREFGPFRSR